MRAPSRLRLAVAASVLLLVVVGMVGCSSTAGKMSGKWLIEGTQETIQFNSGDSLVSSRGPGTYRALGSDGVTLNLSEAGVGGLVSGKYKITFPDGDTMVLVNEESGVTSRLTRAN